MTQVEICIDCSNPAEALISAAAAEAAGAHRIECCASMDEGGLTPDPEIIQTIVDAVGGRIDILVMIRPRSEDFNFSRSERLTMLTSAEEMIALGVDGIVVGSLVNGEIDETFCEEIGTFSSYNGVIPTFHRAFDALDSPIDALQALTDCRFQRILTSGNPWLSGKNATEGLLEIKKYADAFPKMEFVIGGGVSATNAPELLDALAGRRISLHAFSSVLENGRTSRDKVEALVNLARNASS
jgi:copper homeostasis protein